jgi:molecular chaperone DnaJ
LRDGKDLTVDVPVTVGETMFGATITVPTPMGSRVQLKVPSGSQGGQRLRLKGRGVPDLKGGEAGDLYVRLIVQVPTTNPERVKEAVETLAGAYDGDPRANLTF